MLIQNSRGFWTRLFSKKIKKCLFSISAYLKKNVKDVKEICKRKLTPRNILASQVFKTVEIIGKLLVSSEPWMEKDH